VTLRVKENKHAACGLIQPTADPYSDDGRCAWVNVAGAAMLPTGRFWTNRRHFTKLYPKSEKPYSQTRTDRTNRTPALLYTGTSCVLGYVGRSTV